MEKTFKLLPPLMPNFINCELPPGSRQDGFNSGVGVAVSSLTAEEAAEYGELMKQEFLKHWSVKKAQKDVS
jgi:hypothetical protein